MRTNDADFQTEFDLISKYDLSHSPQEDGDLIEESQEPEDSISINSTPTSGDTSKLNDQEFNLSIIPVSSQKVPYGSWAQYQKEQAPWSHWRTHFGNGGYIGIICGSVSGGLEAIDIDVKNDPLRTIHDELTNLIPKDLLDRLIIQTTPNLGYHLIYRCPLIEANQKLCSGEDSKVLIETRGEGGYICHHLKDYQVIQGDMNLVSFNINIPEITPQEREIILNCARSLDRERKKITTQNYSEQAINDFNSEYQIIPLFEQHGWTVYSETGEKITLAKPDSGSPYSGYYYPGTRTFICFSTSTHFKAQKPYNHFQVLGVLEGEDDYHKTLRLLPKYGYEIQNKSKKVTVDDIAEHLNAGGVRYDAFRQDLIYKDEIINEQVYNTLYLDLNKALGKDVPRSKFEVVIKSLYIEHYNPIKEFITLYKDRHPVGTFEQWLDCIVLKNSNVERETVLHFIKKWYVGMIAQALDGEFPNEFFLALLSLEQGVGKTTLLRKYILPEELQEYQAEHSLSFTDDFKVLMGQALLIVDDELDGRSFEQSQSFKNILSTRINTTRRPYDRRISPIKRRSSFAGSGNSLKVVRERGERRIIPLEIDSIHHQKLDEVDLIDLFMEAYHLYMNGFQYSFQSGDKALLDKLYEDHYQESDIDLIIADMMDLPEGEDVFYITNLDIVRTLSELYPQASKRINTPSVGKKMAEHGFELKRLGKKKTTCYIIEGSSRIIELLDKKSQSWRLIMG